ncbi:MAG TPA: hypothetical protein VNF73_03910 [Candidatus Saccharimonadales bacterium]|nr:hypothetical protein [Candidatus Saccharimonadales bacterium]
MATPQTGIFALGTMSHAYLELDLAAGTHAAELVELVASLREPRTTIGGVNLVARFRPELWAAVAARHHLRWLQCRPTATRGDARAGRRRT